LLGVLVGTYDEKEKKVVVTDAFPMAHTIPLAPMTEIFFEFIEHITDKNTSILGLYEGFLKFSLEIQNHSSLPIDSLLIEMA